MKQQVLKALANPPLLLYVPYNLAIGNFIFQFLVFIVLYVSGLVIIGITSPDFINVVNNVINPLYFLISVIIVHLILMRMCKRDPHIGEILIAKFRLFRLRIPRRLVG